MAARQTRRDKPKNTVAAISAPATCHGVMLDRSAKAGKVVITVKGRIKVKTNASAPRNTGDGQRAASKIDANR